MSKRSRKRRRRERERAESLARESQVICVQKSDWKSIYRVVGGGSTITVDRTKPMPTSKCAKPPKCAEPARVPWVPRPMPLWWLDALVQQQAAAAAVAVEAAPMSDVNPEAPRSDAPDAPNPSDASEPNDTPKDASVWEKIWESVL